MINLIVIKEAVIKELKTHIESRYQIKVKPKVTDKLEDDLGLDSLDRVELWTAMEKRYKIDIPEEEVIQMKTVSDVIEIIEKALKNKK